MRGQGLRRSIYLGIIDWEYIKGGTDELGFNTKYTAIIPEAGVDRRTGLCSLPPLLYFVFIFPVAVSCRQKAKEG